MLKIWGRISSVNVQKVVWAADELGIAHERIEAGGTFGVVGTPQYQAMNPNGLVPVIEDDGFVLWESNAIVRYLARKYARGTLSPDEDRKYADADKWMDWQATVYTPAMWAAFWQLIRTPAQERDAKVVEASIAKTEKAAEILDAALAGREFITGDTFTMGDIPIGCATHRWLNMPVWRVGRPNIERWYAALKARPGGAKVLATPVT
jgi:glutathione S-transferase